MATMTQARNAGRARNMTCGSEAGHIIGFALPLLGGNMLQQTYNLADTAIVGHFLGENALAAVGSTGSVTYLFYTLCIGLSIGSGVITAQLFGMGDIKRMRSAVISSGAVTLIFGIVISVLSALLAKTLLRLLNVPEELLADAADYMRIACGGTAAVAAYNWINAVMRALGDAKTPLICLVAASVLNVLLDIFFVVTLQAGVMGAALATVIAQGLSAAVCIIYCFAKFPELRFERSELCADRKMMLTCIRTGLPIAAQNGLVSVSMAALQTVTNGFGETVMAAYTVSMKVEQLIQQPFSSLNAALSAFTGQNAGAGRGDRAARGLKAALAAAFLLAAVMLAVFALFGGRIAGCFVKSEAVTDIARRGMVLTACFYGALGVIHILRGFLNGVGDTGYALVNGAVEVICRIGFAIVLTRFFKAGYMGIWLTTCLTWTMTAAVSVIRYKSGGWKSKTIK